METITTKDIYDCFGIKTTAAHREIVDKKDLLWIIRFCIETADLFKEIGGNNAERN